MGVIMRFLTLSFLLVLSSPAFAQDEAQSRAEIERIFDSGCGDDNGTDRCDPGVHRQMRQLYGISDAQTLMEQGVTLRRAMVVDGYGRDVVAITFERAPGRSPAVSIATPRREGEAQPSPLSAEIDLQTWERVVAASQHFDQKLVSELPRPAVAGEDEAISVCLHGWFVVVETVDAPRLQPNLVGQNMMPGEIRRDAESACADGLAVPYAFDLARNALDNLPECRALNPDFARNAPALLALCHRLGGDRIAARDAMELVDKLGHDANLLPAGRELKWLFAKSADGLSERFRASVAGGNFYLGVPHASDADHAEVKGEIAFWGSEDRLNERADITLSLVRQSGNFLIQSYEISPRRAAD